MQVSRFGVTCIPKKHQPGKWRLIVDLSAPEGKSVNDGISKPLCSLKYTTVREVAAHVHMLGKGALMANMDVKSAFRNIPVHPDGHLLLGTQWENQYFIDTVLPFGLRSAPKIFNAMADALHLVSEHIRGIDNDLADDLSRNQLASFVQKSGLQTSPTAIPSKLLDMLMGSRPDWTSQSWKQLFNDTLNRA